MKATKKSNPFKIVLEFETRDDAENWVAYYLDGGGDQQSMYGADLDQSVWRGKVSEFKFTLKGYRQCPDCRFSEIGTVEEYKERWGQMMQLDKTYKVKDKTKTHKCQNCTHECNEEDIVNA